MSYKRTEAHTSRRTRQADCGHYISRGDRYLVHIAAPGDSELGNWKFWLRLTECGVCATRYGRRDKLGLVGQEVPEAFFV